MTARSPTPRELRERGWQVLARELGYADAMRFLLQYESGRGDYTTERDALLPGWDVAEITRRAEALLEERRRTGT